MAMHFPNIGQAIVNLVSSVPAIYQMVTAIAYVMGLYFATAGIMKFKTLAHAQSMSAATGQVKGPLIYLLVGSMLLFYPSILQVSLQTFFQSNSVLAYPTSHAITHQIIASVIIIVRVIGAIAFIRGWVLMSHLAGQQSAPNTFSKALTHIIGGIFAINIYGVWEILKTTLVQ